MGRRPLPRGGVRLASVGFGLFLAAGLGAGTASASSTVHLGAQPVSAPLHVVVGDLIQFSIAPLSGACCGGGIIQGTVRYPIPQSSNTAVLAQTSAGYEANGTMDATFTAIKAGTANIEVQGPSFEFCQPGQTTTTSTTTTTSRTSSTASPGPSPGCAAVAATMFLDPVTVSAATVQGVNVPAAGAGSLVQPGALLALLGALAAAVVLLRSPHH